MSIENFLDLYKPGIIKATASLTEQEKQLLVLISTKVSVADPLAYKKNYVFDISEVYKAIGMPVVNDYKPLYKVVSNLIKKIITFEKGKSFLKVGWLSSATYNESEFTVAFSFNPYMQTFFQHLRDYMDLSVIQIDENKKTD